MSYAFTVADDDEPDRILDGVITYDTTRRGVPSAGEDPDSRYGGAEFFLQPVYLDFVLDDRRITFGPSPASPIRFAEAILANGPNPDTPLRADFINFALISETTDGTLVDLALLLEDSTGTAFDTRWYLPADLDLDAFDRTRFRMFLPGTGSIFGQVTSLTRLPTAITPEPASVALIGIGAVMAGAGAWARRRRAV